MISKWSLRPDRAIAICNQMILHLRHSRETSGNVLLRDMGFTEERGTTAG
jgi:hypothetical protein